MKTLNLSLVDRSAAINSLPKSGSLAEVKKYRKWAEELKMTESEKETQKSIQQSRDVARRDEELNKWFHEPNEFQISDNLYDYLVEDAKRREESKGFTVDDPFNLYDQLLRYE